MGKAEQETPPVSDVVWEAPVELRVRYDWQALAGKMRSKPGEWAKIFDDDRTSLVNAIRQGKVAALHPDLGFQVLTRKNVRTPIRKCALYMRYVPKGEE